MEEVGKERATLLFYLDPTDSTLLINYTNLKLIGLPS
jgi:hypothetical protein